MQWVVGSGLWVVRGGQCIASSQYSLYCLFRCNKYGYNELVIDPATVVAALPGSVIAIFHMASSSLQQVVFSSEC